MTNLFHFFLIRYQLAFQPIFELLMRIEVWLYHTVLNKFIITCKSESHQPFSYFLKNSLAQKNVEREK